MTAPVFLRHRSRIVDTVNAPLNFVNNEANSFLPYLNGDKILSFK